MKQFFYIILVVFLFSSCTKQADTITSSTDTTTNSGGTTTITSPPTIKFFNVMDYGNVYPTFNSKSLGALAQYYPTGYKTGVIGTNSIVVVFNGSTIISENVDLIAGKNYSCFVYRVGYDWKLSVVSDDLTKPASGSSKVRLLDFRSQAYFDYIGARFFSPGNLTLDYSNRNFLDHQSFDTYTTFKTITAGLYTLTLFTTTDNLLTKSNITFASTKIYTVLLMTQASLSAADALKAINVDIEENY